jgi:hypothetical protein
MSKVYYTKDHKNGILSEEATIFFGTIEPTAHNELQVNDYWMKMHGTDLVEDDAYWSVEGEIDVPVTLDLSEKPELEDYFLILPAITVHGI